MKKKTIIIILLVLLQNSIYLFAQKDTLEKKNTFVFGLNYASNGSNKQDAILYRTEYIRDLNKTFSLGFGFGFYNFTDSLISSGNNYSSKTIISFDLTPYVNIINRKKHLIRFGVGYSLQKYKFLEWYETIEYTLEDGTRLHVSHYKLTNTFINTYFIHLEYGFRITRSWTISALGRLYSEQLYHNLSYWGVNILYSF